MANRQRKLPGKANRQRKLPGKANLQRKLPGDGTATRQLTLPVRLFLGGCQALVERAVERGGEEAFAARLRAIRVVVRRLGE